MASCSVVFIGMGKCTSALCSLWVFYIVLVDTMGTYIMIYPRGFIFYYYTVMRKKVHIVHVYMTTNLIRITFYIQFKFHKLRQSLLSERPFHRHVFLANGKIMMNVLPFSSIPMYKFAGSMRTLCILYVMKYQSRKTIC